MRQPNSFALVPPTLIVSKKDIIDLINSPREDTFLLVTDFENDLHLDDFAKLIRAILDQANGRLKLITMGGEKLANLQTN